MGQPGAGDMTIRNGLYHIRIEMLDAVQGGNQGVMVMRDGTMRGGDSFFFAYGSYSSADGKWKGELTNEEHSPSFDERPVWEHPLQRQSAAAGAGLIIRVRPPGSARR
jgi:hypothetical protein